MNFWDHNFSGTGYKYGTAPNAFIAAEAQRLAPRSRVLVPGDGEGTTVSGSRSKAMK